MNRGGNSQCITSRWSGNQEIDVRVGGQCEILACYLLAEGAAEPVSDDTPTEILPPEKQMFAPSVDVPAQNHDLPRSDPTPDMFPLAERLTG